MKCVVCKIGETEKGRTTVTLRRNSTVVIVEDVDAHICNNCGHYYLDSDTAKTVMAKLKDALQRGTKLEILPLKAA
jgi:YgiT-type zinc finger domain-containing protein